MWLTCQVFARVCLGGSSISSFYIDDLFVVFVCVTTAAAAVCACVTVGQSAKKLECKCVCVCEPAGLLLVWVCVCVSQVCRACVQRFVLQHLHSSMFKMQPL